MITASYVVSQSSLVTIPKELAKAKQTNCQLRKNAHIPQPKQSAAPQPIVTKPIVTQKAVLITTHPVSKTTVQFSAKCIAETVQKQWNQYNTYCDTSHH